MVIKRVGGEMLGKTSGKKPPDDKQTWRRNDEVTEEVKAKKDAKKFWEKYGQQEDKERYQRHKKQVKNAVAQEKARALDNTYKELETPEGERKIHRTAKSRDKNNKDYSLIKQVKDGNGVVLCNEEIKKWKEYYEHLLNEENPTEFFEDGFQNLGMTRAISRKEVKKALKKMKKGHEARRRLISGERQNKPD
ncbi:uncharacterized protein [Macrobrachium rosenbergii]|uniref:uncharacterized protein n=1 Tax=Macrobrachium rosenbergii TaxID=79674 RepID=UPI0034D5C12F